MPVRRSRVSLLTVAVLVLLASIFAIGASVFGLQIANYVHLRRVESHALTVDDLPPPPPSCECCDKCSTTLAYQCSCCRFCPSCDDQLSLAVQRVTENVITLAEGGGAIPPDTTMAVGNNDNGGRIIAVVNRAVAIINKATHTRISLASNFYGTGLPGGDPYVSWDPTSNRFFLTAFQTNPCRYGITTYSPPAVAGGLCVGDAQFGPRSFFVNAMTQVGSPLQGCSTMAPLTGKIAIVTRGTCGFAVKVKNAQNAGAVGVVVVNTLDSTLGMGGADPTIVIPSVLVALTPGNALIANAPSNTTIRSGGQTSYSTTMYISVSNTSSPNTRADFAHYTVSDGLYEGSFADYPKHSTSADTFYLASQNFGNSTDGIGPCLGAHIRAFDKAALMSGAGANTLWSQVVPGMGITGPTFLFPAATRTPITDQKMPALFVGLDTGNSVGFCDLGSFEPTPATAIVIYTGTSAGLASYVGSVPFPTPMTFGSCYPWAGNASCITQPLARQPAPAVPYGLETYLGVIVDAVLHDGLLYAVMMHNTSDVQTAVRWFIIDANPIPLKLQPVLLQWGDLNFSPDIDTFYPKIDVNDDGTMAILFYSSGPRQAVMASYTVRLESDAPYSIRTPFHKAVPNAYRYFEDVGTGRNRFGDYMGFQVDPVDRRTFYGFSQRPDPVGLFNPPNQLGPCLNISGCVARQWTTDLFTFRADIDECPTDGVQTVSKVLPSTSPQTGAPPVTGPAADRALFARPQTDNCISVGQKRLQQCLE